MINLYNLIWNLNILTCGKSINVVSDKCIFILEACNLIARLNKAEPV